MSLMLYGFNVILKRKALDRVIKEGSASFIKRIMERTGAGTISGAGTAG